MNDYYVYVDPRNHEEFYFGQGCGSRKKAHLADTSDTKKTQRIAAIRKAGLEPIIRVIARGLSERIWSFPASTTDVVCTTTLSARVRTAAGTTIGSSDSFPRGKDGDGVTRCSGLRLGMLSRRISADMDGSGSAS